MLTVGKDLRSGKTLWEARPSLRLKSNSNLFDFYDVIVVGAGITGALIAERLSRKRQKLLVLDKRGPACGSTSASTALIQWEIDVPLTSLKRKIGSRKAHLAYRASFKSVQDLVRLIRKLRLSCEFRRRTTMLLAGSSMGPTRLRREAMARQAIGLPSRFESATSAKRKFGLPREAMIVSGGSCEINPVRLAKSLLQVVKKRQGHLHFPAEVKHIFPSAAGVFVVLGTGRTIACQKLVVSTGYEVIPEIPKHKYRLVSTWAVATKPLRGKLWHRHALIWEAADPYIYMRTTKDSRIVAGGEDEDFINEKKRDALTPKKSQVILRKLKHHFPDLRVEAEYAWAGTFAESPTGLPVIGAVAGLPNVFAVLSAGGNGITYGMIASELADHWFKGKSHPFARLFTPDANPSSTLRPKRFGT
jgi:glycine/D-amino acid oxidase-like deaminating enzyme